MRSRIDRACRIAEELSLDALVIENPADVFYLTGKWFSSARLILRPKRACLLVDGRYFAQAKGAVPCEVVLAEKDALNMSLKGLKKAGFDSAFITVDARGLLQTTAPDIEWAAVSRPLKELRVCKDEGEIAALKRAARLTYDGYKAAEKSLKAGVSEEELALEFEIFCRRHGASRLSFDPIVAFEKNSAYPHHRAGKARLEKDQIVLFDLGAVVDSYRGDMTRVVFFGKIEPELERFYELVKEAHDMAAAKVKPGTRLGDLDAIVREFFAKEGVERFFSHGLGHGVGIDVHEYPLVRADGNDRDLILRPGMVFTIEPGLYQPGLGGVRYENTFAVIKNGCENFYADV